MTLLILAVSVTLMWNANPESNIAGYRYSVRVPGATPAPMVDVGNVRTATVQGLTVGTVYNFGLTAYNTVGIESALSKEVAYVPTATTPTPTPMPGLITVEPTEITFTGLAGGPYPVRQSIKVTTANGANWKSSDSSPWFNTSDTDSNHGVSGASCTLTPHTEGLGAGTYTENITFSAPGLPNKVVLVTLKLTPKPSPTPTATPKPTATPRPTPRPSSPTPTCTPCACRS